MFDVDATRTCSILFFSRFDAIHRLPGLHVERRAGLQRLRLPPRRGDEAALERRDVVAAGCEIRELVLAVDVGRRRAFAEPATREVRRRVDQHRADLRLAQRLAAVGRDDVSADDRRLRRGGRRRRRRRRLRRRDLRAGQERRGDEQHSM